MPLSFWGCSVWKAEWQSLQVVESKRKESVCYKRTTLEWKEVVFFFFFWLCLPSLRFSAARFFCDVNNSLPERADLLPALHSCRCIYWLDDMCFI